MTKLPDWLPDWRDEANYPDHGQDCNLWAWEFLRRNPKYQSDWDSLGVGHSKGQALDDDGMYIDTTFVHLDPGRPPKDSLAHKGPMLGKKWGLVGPIVDPSHPKPTGQGTGKFNFSAEVIHWWPPEPYEDAGSFGSIPKDETKPSVTFDLTREINPQVDRVKQVLERGRKQLIQDGVISGKSPRVLNNEWREYLRILDAKTNNVAPKMIAAEIFPENLQPRHASESAIEALERETKRIRTAFNRAKEIRDGGYLSLAR